MKPRSNAFRSRQMRGLGVAGAIAGAAAAVAASVVIAERPQNDRLLPPSASAELVSPGGASRSEPRVRTRSPKDAGRLIPGPWVQRSGIAEWADNARCRCDHADRRFGAERGGSVEGRRRCGDGDAADVLTAG